MQRQKAFNLHPALLPKYVGMHAIEICFKSSDEIYGATIHYATQEVDLGHRVARVVLQRKFKDSLETFTHRLFVNQSVFFLDFVAKIVSGISFEILSDKIILGIAPFPLFICKKDIIFFNAQDSLYLQI